MYIPDGNLSTAIIVMGITCVMILWSIQNQIICDPGCAGLALILIGVQILGAMLSTSESFRLRRILVWLNPEEYASEGGYQVMQGLLCHRFRRIFRERPGKQRAEDDDPGSAE